MTILNKVWAGSSRTAASTTAGDYSAADNWLPHSIRNADYRWLASGSGTAEYYLDLSGGGDPGLAQPANVQYNNAGTRTNLVAGSLGSLAAGEWGFGDNDSLGYSVPYVRLPDDTDPDSKDLDYVTFTSIPAAGDNVRIPATSTVAIAYGLNQRGVAIADFIVEEGYLYNLGFINNPLYIDPDRFVYSGGGNISSYIDIGTAAIDVKVTGTPTVTTGKRGLVLTGSAIDELVIDGGNVGIATVGGQTAAVSVARIKGGNLVLGSGVSLTTFRSFGGTTEINCAFTTGNVFGGNVTTRGAGAITTLNGYGGTIYPESTGEIGTLLLQGATVDFTRSLLARVVTTLKRNWGNIKYDPGVLTITNKSDPDYPVQEIISQAT